jgi:hypothetical protein
MTQEHEIETVTLLMGESTRPQQIAIYKSNGTGGFDNLIPWVYQVTDQSICSTYFGVSVKLVPNSIDSVVCQQYSTQAAQINEMVTF